MVNFCTDPSDKYFFIFVQIMYTVQVCIMNNVPNDTKNSICLSVFKRMVRAFLMDNILHVKVALFLKWTLVFKTLCPYFFCYQKILRNENLSLFCGSGANVIMAFFLEWQRSWWQISWGDNLPSGIHTSRKFQAGMTQDLTNNKYSLFLAGLCPN